MFIELSWKYASNFLPPRKSGKPTRKIGGRNVLKKSTLRSWTIHFNLSQFKTIIRRNSLSMRECFYKAAVCWCCCYYCWWARLRFFVPVSVHPFFPTATTTTTKQRKYLSFVQLQSDFDIDEFPIICHPFPKGYSLSMFLPSRGTYLYKMLGSTRRSEKPI